MAVTRSSAARARLFHLLALPDDLLLKVALHALAMEVPAALRLLQTCKALQARLGVVPAEAKALKLCWVEEGMVHHTISEDGLTLTQQEHGSTMPWASAPLLPTVGRSTWAVRVEQTRGNLGILRIGVCDAAGRNAWTLFLFDGLLHRDRRDEHGHDMYVKDEETGNYKRAPPPDPAAPAGGGSFSSSSNSDSDAAASDDDDAAADDDATTILPARRVYDE